MQTTEIILVMGSEAWSLRAIHLACALTRSCQGHLTLVNMIPVKHPMQLGLGYNDDAPSRADMTLPLQLEQLGTPYDVPIDPQVYHFASYRHGLISLVEQLDAVALFAPMPKTLPPLVKDIFGWFLRRHLAHMHCSLYTLEPPEPPLEWVPVITHAH